jgi:hypothetical protein
MRAAFFLGWASLWLATIAHADESRSRWTSIEIALEGAFGVELEAAVRADLEASLRADGLLPMRPTESRARASARVRVRAPSADIRVCAVLIEEGVTGRTLERNIDLARVPRDGWSVAIAAGVSELLRATSPASLGRAFREEPPTMHAPPLIDTSDADGGYHEELAFVPTLAIGARSAFEFFLGGQMLVGGDVLTRFFFASRLALEVSLGARLGLDVVTPRGRIRSSALLVDVGPNIRILSEPSQVRLDAFLLARVAQVMFEADPYPGSTAQTAESLVIALRMGMRLLFAIERSEIGIELGLGVPVLGFEVSDERSVLTGVSGMEVRGGLSFFSEVIP